MKRVLIFIGLKIAELMGFCLFMLLLGGFLYLAKEYLVLAILKWIVVGIIVAAFVVCVGIWNWEMAKILKDKWFGGKK